MDRYINLTDPESRALNAGASVLIVPVIPRFSTVLGRKAVASHDAHEWSDGWINLDFSKAWTDGTPDTRFGQYLHVPLANDADERVYRVRSLIDPGDILHAKERWAHHYTGVGRFPMHYRADLPADPDAAMTANHAFGLMKWQPARTLTKDSIRHKYPVKSISAIRVSEIGEEDALKAGVSRKHVSEHWSFASEKRFRTAVFAYQDWWQSRYPKLPWESWAWRVEVER